MTLTRQRNLRDGRAVWTSYKVAQPAPHRRLRSQRADVVVVGARISGAKIAESLTEIGLQSRILDRRRGVLLGSPPAGTALLQFKLDTTLCQLSLDIVRHRVEQFWRASGEAVNELRNRTARLDIAAYFQMRATPSLPY